MSIKVYIAGPMSGFSDLNFPAFKEAAVELRKVGFDVINPAELNPSGDDYATCMRKDIAELITCDAVWLLPGWEKSKGARLEYQIAVILGLSVVRN